MSGPVNVEECNDLGSELLLNWMFGGEPKTFGTAIRKGVWADDLRAAAVPSPAASRVRKRLGGAAV
jgi:hypothetical protein